MYNHYKHGNLSPKEKAIIRNTSNSSSINKEVESQKNVSKKDGANMGLIKMIDREILKAMGSVAALPQTHLETFETIWFNLKEKIEDYSRNNNLDKKTEQLIVELMTNEECLAEARIENRGDICGKLDVFAKIVNRYLD